MKTILVADDHDHLRLLVSKTLGGPDYRIVEAHGGSVGVKSKPGAGSEFWFELPLARSDS